jgi:hypothetical protein
VIWLRPYVVAGLGAGGVAVARHNPENGPVILGVAAAVAILAVLLRERGAALAALGVGASAAFVSPDGLGALLVASGVVLTFDVAAADARLIEWRHVIDAVIALPGLAGIAGSVAAQPSHRAVALGVTAAVVVAGSAVRGRAGTGNSTLAVLGVVAAFVVTLAPDRIRAFDDLPVATVQAARSVAAGLAVFALAGVIAELPRPSRPRGRHREPSAQ